MSRVCHSAWGYIAAVGAAVLASAAMAQERQGLHVFIIADRVTGQVMVDRRVEGPFRGTATAAGRERERIAAAVARNGEVIRDQITTTEPGNCILVYRSGDRTQFASTIRSAPDMDDRLRELRAGKTSISIVLDKECL